MDRRRFLKLAACATGSLSLFNQVSHGQGLGDFDLTFFALSDTHMGAVHHETKAVKTKSKELDYLNELVGTPYPSPLGGTVQTPRGVIMAGDLVDNGGQREKCPKEWNHWVQEFGLSGDRRCKYPVFECYGNHDANPDLFVVNRIIERNKERLKLGLIDRVSGNGFHYSWDWNGVHFVNVNLFPGSEWAGEADAYGIGHDPLKSREFLEEDLRKHVGDSGRPVIVIQHFRPIDVNWWTHAAADKAHRVLQDYNVILIMCGHQGGGIQNTWRGIDWATSNGQLEVFRISGNQLAGAVRDKDAWGQTLQKTFYRSYRDCHLPAVVNNGDWAVEVARDCAGLTGKILHQAASPTEATFYSGTTDGDRNPDAWDHAVSAGTQQAGRLFRADLKGLRPWTQYYYRVCVRNAGGEAWADASIPFYTKGLLPSGWDERFIGYSQRAGDGAHCEDGKFIVRGSGRDIGEAGQPDNFEYASRQVGEHATLQAHLDRMEGRTREAKAGVMFRGSTDPQSPHLALLVNSREEVRLYTRAEQGHPTAVHTIEQSSVPVWLRITRQDKRFTAYTSADGITWNQAGEPVEIAMPPVVHAGLAVTAGNRDGSDHKTAVFSDVHAG